MVCETASTLMTMESTFDNTGDIGDKARVVYVLDNTVPVGIGPSVSSSLCQRSGLGELPSKSVWVGEKMFEQYIRPTTMGVSADWSPGEWTFRIGMAKR